MLKKIIVSTFAAISMISSPAVFSAEKSDAAQHKQSDDLKSFHLSQDATEQKESGSGSENNPNAKRMQQPRQMQHRPRGGEITEEGANDSSNQERKFGPKG